MPARVVAVVMLVTCAACGRVGFETVGLGTDSGAPPRMDASVDAHASIDAAMPKIDAPEAQRDAGDPTGIDAAPGHDSGVEPDSGAPPDSGPTDAGPVAAADLVGWWRMDDDPTDGSTDDSAASNAAMCEPIDRCPSSSAGLFGSAISFTGDSDGYFVAPHVPAYATTTGFTVSVWVDMPWQRASVVTKLYLDGTDWSNSWQIETEVDGRVSFTVNNGPGHSYGWTTVTLPADTWTHLAGTWDGAVRRLYMNGTQVFEMTGSVGFDDGDVWIGADFNGGRTLEMTGRVDDVRIYDRALTPAEVGMLAVPPGGM